MDEVYRIAERDGLEVAVVAKWVRAFFDYREGPPVQGDGANPSVVFEIWDTYAAADPSTYEKVHQWIFRNQQKQYIRV